MGVHLLIVLGLALICIVFGLLRAELGQEEADENPICEGCEECEGDKSSCGHFCFCRPATDVKKLLELE
ncbi:MAG: hypothetical protein P8020_05355 [Acidobacteriota bacterium]|jgi:hypothetical protein